jgi:hypothetical protein
MKENTTQKRRPKGPIRVGLVVAAIAITLMMQKAAHAWWLMGSYLVWRGGW